MLNAFFIGRALAETVNERLGSAVGDVLAEIGKIDAELRRSLQYVPSFSSILLYFSEYNFSPFFTIFDFLFCRQTTKKLINTLLKQQKLQRISG